MCPHSLLMKRSLILLLTVFGISFIHAEEAQEYINQLQEKRSGTPVVIKDKESIRTEAFFKPPVEITVVAKTDSTNLRLGYAADQLIFNWEGNGNQLRVDGGPAAGKHKFGAGSIPTNRYVTIRWVVLPHQQTIYVDDQLRYQHDGDYSKIDNPVSVFCHNSKVSVKSILIRRITP